MGPAAPAPCYHRALSPVSPVRMRTASWIGEAKTLPSPTLPDLAASTMVFDRLLVVGVLDDDLDFDLGDEINAVLGAAIDLAMAALAAKSPHFGYGHAGDAPFA